MPNLVAMSFEGEVAPTFDLTCLAPGGHRPDGWGLAHYPAGGAAADLRRDPTPTGQDGLTLEHLPSSLFMLHLREATWGRAAIGNTQPFLRAWAGRDWLCAHAGSLSERPALSGGPAFEPVGSTDSELVFCEILARLAARGWRTLGDADLATVREWFLELNAHGTLTMTITDGRDLLAYVDARGASPLYLHEYRPNQPVTAFNDLDVVVDLARKGTESRSGVLLCTAPLSAWTGSAVPRWLAVRPGGLVVVRQGVRRAEFGDAVETPAPRRRAPPRPQRAEPRTLDVSHRTTYRYASPVERSAHVLRLVPVHDHEQSLLSCDVSLSVEGQQRDFVDVFGNRARRVELHRPFTELVIEAKSRVVLLDTDPLSFRPLRARTEVPLVWMPWQRVMLEPYLLPPELAESQLHELYEYATSFVERNDGALLETLLDLNDTLHRDYQYKQGLTTLATSPFDFYVDRRGVCQDFTGLFVCLARLLGIPARYVCGYLYTGPKAENRAMAEATHAWAQVYLPEVGWRGFDPTNGVLTQTDHVRVAIGRTWVDATPTSGTLYAGGGRETLEVEVKVEPVVT